MAELGLLIAPAQPGRRGDVAAAALGEAGPAAAVVVAEPDRVAKLPAVHARDGHSAGPARIDRKAHVAALRLLAADGRDVGPPAAARVQPPNRPAFHLVRADRCRVRYVEVALFVELALRGKHVSARTARHGMPAAAAIARAEEMLLARIGNGGVDGRRAAARPSRRRVEQHETDAGVGPPRPRRPETLVRKAFHLAPAAAAVVAALQAVVAGAEHQSRGVVRVDREPLAEAAPVLVSAHLERHRHDRPGRPLVARAQDRRLAGKVHARGEIDDVRVERVGSDAFDAHVAADRSAVLQRHPAAQPVIPSIRSAHVGAQIGQPPFGAAEDDVGREAAGADHDVFPFVRDARDGAGRSCTRSQRRDNQRQQQCEAAANAQRMLTVCWRPS